MLDGFTDTITKRQRNPGGLMAPPSRSVRNPGPGRGGGGGVGRGGWGKVDAAAKERVCVLLCCYILKFFPWFPAFLVDFVDQELTLSRRSLSLLCSLLRVSRPPLLNFSRRRFGRTTARRTRCSTSGRTSFVDVGLKPPVHPSESPAFCRGRGSGAEANVSKCTCKNSSFVYVRLASIEGGVVDALP